MATLAELAVLQSRGTTETDAMFERTKGAVLVAAEAIRVEAAGTVNHAARLVWAKEAFVDPRTKASDLWGAILAANATASIAQILAATDAALQSAVNNAVNLYAV